MSTKTKRNHQTAQILQGIAETNRVKKPARDKLEAIIAHIEKRPKRSLFHPGSIKNHANANRPADSHKIASDLRASFQIEAIDRALDGKNASGIAINALHEVRVENGLAAASGAGFALCLGLMMQQARSQTTRENLFDDKAPVFWISDQYTRQEYGQFYSLGINTLGLKVERLVRVHIKSKQDLLWAAGEIAGTAGASAFCLIEIQKHPKEMDLTATRRLLLRAQASMTPVILLRQSSKEEASAAATRWLVSPAPSQMTSSALYEAASPLLHQFIGPPTFDVTLEKSRGGHANPSTRWTIEWNRNEQRFVSIEHARIPTRNDYCAKDHDTATRRNTVKL